MKSLLGLFLLLTASLQAQVFWKPVNSAGQSAVFWGVASSPDQLVAVGTNGTIISSSDGTFWSGENSGTTNWLLGVANGNGTWVTVGDLGTILWADSSLHWTAGAYATGPNNVRLNNVAFGGGKFVAVGESGVIFTSTDGKSWTSQTSGVATALRGITYGAMNGGQNYYLASGANGVILYSLDAITWTRAFTSTTNFLEAIVINKGAAVIAGQNGTIMQATAPTNWSLKTTGTTAWLRGLASDGLGNYAASGELGTILTSSNGTTWTLQPAGTHTVPVTNNLLSATYSANLNHFLCVGDVGSIVVSTDPTYLANVATRGFVGTGSNVLIAGFIVGGPTPKRVLIRAIGPSLAAYGLDGLLAQPVLTIFDSTNKVVTQNTGWANNNATASQAQITLVTNLTGAFPIQPTSADSVVLTTLAPGAYTAQVSGANTTTGTALVEVYQLP